MVAISSYFASVGIRVDESSLKAVDRYLARIEGKLKKGVADAKLSFTPKINVPAFDKHLRQVLRTVGTGDQKALRINVRVSESHLRKSIEKATETKPINAKVLAQLDRASIATIKEQLRKALSDLTINAKLGSVLPKQRMYPASSYTKQGAGVHSPVGPTDTLSHAQLNTIRRQIARGIVGDSKSAEYWNQVAKLQTKTQQELLTQLQRMKSSTPNSWNPNPWGGSNNKLARWTEFLSGRPEKSSLSAANRRMSDQMMQGLTGAVPNTLRGMLAETTLGGIGRIGSSTAVGRGLGALGFGLGGARGGALGLIGGALVKTVTSGMTMAWKGVGAVLTAPFKIVGSAASMVTSSFYRLALAAAPLIAGFAYINKTVQQSQQRAVALNTVSRSLGSTGKAESDWLMQMAQRDGLRYNTLIDPYTTFIASASPAMGLPMAKNIFESFTQFGLTRGANDVSMGLAMKAVSQMAGKGKIQAEEMRGQLGDAPGFGEMQGIFAEAYQMSLGRSGAQLLRGQKAIEELNAAMEKGNVYSAKVLPYVAEIAKRMAEPGLAEARGASFAEQARFDNQVSRGWTNFREGGGEQGLSYFWQMMQRMGDWWEQNGARFGDYFRIFTTDLNTIRVAIGEFFEFASSGIDNDLVQIFRGWGVDLISLRNEVVQMIGTVETIFRGDSERSWTDTLKVKIQNFTISLRGIMQELNEMLQSIALFFEGYNRWREAPLWRKLTLTAFESQGMMIQGVAGATVDAGQASAKAAEAVLDLLGNSKSNAKSQYELYGNGRQGFTPTIPTTPFVPTNPLPSMSPTQMYTPAMKNVMEQNLTGNININMRVEGNPDLAGQLANPEVQSVVRKQVEDGIKNMLISTLPEAPQY